MKDWTDKIPSDQLIWIQKFYGRGQILAPLCDKCHANRSVGLWMDHDRKAFALCFKCSSGEEHPIEGVSYRREAL